MGEHGVPPRGCWVSPSTNFQKQGRRLIVPNPHGTDLDWTLVKRVLSQGRISPEEWEAARE